MDTGLPAGASWWSTKGSCTGFLTRLQSVYEIVTDESQAAQSTRAHLSSNLVRMSVSAIQARASGCALRVICSSAPTRRTKLSAIPAVSRCGRNAFKTSLCACKAHARCQCVSHSTRCGLRPEADRLNIGAYWMHKALCHVCCVPLQHECYQRAHARQQGVGTMTGCACLQDRRPRMHRPACLTCLFLLPGIQKSLQCLLSSCVHKWCLPMIDPQLERRLTLRYLRICSALLLSRMPKSLEKYPANAQSSAIPVSALQVHHSPTIKVLLPDIILSSCPREQQSFRSGSH